MPLRQMGLVAAIALLATILPLPATALSDGCIEVWEDFVVWSEEVERGVDPITLDELAGLTDALERCRPDAGGSHHGMGSEVEVWRPLAGIYFADSDIDRVMCLMDLESGGNPNARNPRSGAAGLMQVLPSWAGVFGYEIVDLFDPSVNLWIAAQIAEDYGWTSWSPYQRGACR